MYKNQGPGKAADGRACTDNDDFVRVSYGIFHLFVYFARYVS